MSDPTPTLKHMKQNCPKNEHFHISAKDVFELKNFEVVITATNPNEALDIFIKDLPNDWEGGIEVDDDKSRGKMDMPLIDFWRTPLKK